MSLVNDMLRDLEERNKKDAVTGSGAPLKAAQTSEYGAARSDSRTRGVRLAAGCVVLIVLGVLGWLFLTGQIERSIAAAGYVQHKPDEQTQAEDTKPVAAKVNVAVEPEVTEQAVKIHTILWSGTDAGGDLVVRLDGEADIQLLGQDSTAVSIAFEDVKLDAELPVISGALIDRIDLFRDDSRTELMLTTQVQSQFAFRVQHSPTTMILGVLPKSSVSSNVPEMKNEPEAQSVPVQPVQKVAKPVVKTQPREKPEPVADVLASAPPVKKAKRIITDQEATDQARKFIQQGQLATALEVLKKRIATEPQKSVSARGYLAALQLSAGMYQEAKQVLLQGRQVHPDNLTLRKLQARLLLTEGDRSQALMLLQQSLPRISDDPEYYELLATAQQQQGHYAESAQVYYSLLQYKNNTPRWWVGMAYSFELDKRYDEALRAYRSAVQIPGITASLKTYAEQRVQALSGR